MSVIERVIYSNCPLVEVVYQVDFPVILAIDANQPVEFQEKVRELYPEYSVQVEQENQVTINTKQSAIPAIIQQRPARKLYQFISQDGNWRITLAKNMLSFSSQAYTRWEDMSEKFMIPFNALVDIYRPTFFSRIGMRYIDVFEKTRLNVEKAEWSELLKPHLCGCLSYQPDGVMEVNASAVTSELNINGVYVKMTSGIGTIDHHDGKAPARAFILDCDYYKINKFEKEIIHRVFSELHDRSNVFFRDSITEKLHNAMEPSELT